MKFAIAGIFFVTDTRTHVTVTSVWRAFGGNLKVGKAISDEASGNYYSNWMKCLQLYGLLFDIII